MALREILVAPDPKLKIKARRVETFDDELRKLLDDMVETMYAAKGIGLAAPQIGVPLRAIVMDLARDEEEASPRKFLNPEIVWESEEEVPCEEGCLSVPGQYAEVTRPRNAACAIRTRTACGMRSIATACWPCASSTRWTISKACCSSTICRRSSAT